MNRAYRVVWNRACGAFQAVSELASACGASGTVDIAAPSTRAWKKTALQCLSTLLLACSGIGLSRADGGNGGSLSNDPASVAQGGGDNQGTGGNGGVAIYAYNGGGGGGPGASGGNNIDGVGGGSAGIVGGGDGGSGTAGTDILGGGGGGGGGYGGKFAIFVGGGLWRGGNGGNGGDAVSTAPSAGGGGGAGGYGVILAGNIAGANNGAIFGGNGGNGGSGGGGVLSAGGDGGDGGVGLQVTYTAGMTITNNGSINGGNGGSGGQSGSKPGVDGAGGAGMVGAGLTVYNFGQIAGGLGRSGRANAITFTGGNNNLFIEGGSSFIGNVVALGGGQNVLALDYLGTGPLIFDTSSIGTQFQGFNSVYVSNGNTASLPANWTLTGVNNAVLNWRIEDGGEIGLSSDGALGDVSSRLSFAGGILQWKANFNLDARRPIVLGGGGGVFDTNGFNTEISQAISGTGNLEKAGAGTLILSGDNLYTGSTAVTGGTLQIGNGSSGSIAGDVTDNAILVIDRDDDFVFTGNITGSGNLIKKGAGILDISGSHAYTGNTTVLAGTLYFPQYAQSSSSVLSIGVSGAGAAEYGKLGVGGTATFASGAKLFVDVDTANALAPNQTLAGVILAGVLNAGTFDVTDNSALLDFQAVINGNAVDLHTVLAPSNSNIGGITSAVNAGGAFSSLGAARVLDGILQSGGSGDMANVVSAFGSLSSQHEVARGVAQTLPLLSGGVAQSTLGMLGSFDRVLQNRIDGAGTAIAWADIGSGIATGESGPDRHAWAKAFGSHASQGDQNGSSGFNANSWGTALGADSEIAPGALLGASYAYANSRVDGNTALSGTSQHADIDSHMLAIYGAKTFQNDMQIDFQADIGRSHTNGSRQIDFGGLNRTASSSYVSYSAHAGAGLSKDIALNRRATFTPAVRIDYTRLRDQGYSESGADALNLNVDGNTTRAFVVGAEGRLLYALNEHSSLAFNLGAGYDTVNDRGNIVSVYAGAPGQSFATPGIDHSPWLVNAGIGYTYQTNSGAQVALRYDVDGRGGYLNQTASLKAGWMF